MSMDNGKTGKVISGTILDNVDSIQICKDLFGKKVYQVIMINDRWPDMKTVVNLTEECAKILAYKIRGL